MLIWMILDADLTGEDFFQALLAQEKARKQESDDSSQMLDLQKFLVNQNHHHHHDHKHPNQKVNQMISQKLVLIFEQNFFFSCW